MRDRYQKYKNISDTIDLEAIPDEWFASRYDINAYGEAGMVWIVNIRIRKISEFKELKDEQKLLEDFDPYFDLEVYKSGWMYKMLYTLSTRSSSQKQMKPNLMFSFWEHLVLTKVGILAIKKRAVIKALSEDSLRLNGD